MFPKPLPYESKVEFDSKPVLLDECFALPPSEPPRPDVPPTFTESKKKFFLRSRSPQSKRYFFCQKPLKMNVEAQGKPPPEPVTPEKEIEETKPLKVQISMFL